MLILKPGFVFPSGYELVIVFETIYILRGKINLLCKPSSFMLHALKSSFNFASPPAELLSLVSENNSNLALILISLCKLPG